MVYHGYDIGHIWPSFYKLSSLQHTNYHPSKVDFSYAFAQPEFCINFLALLSSRFINK
jgi:hypothetical protein